MRLLPSSRFAKRDKDALARFVRECRAGADACGEEVIGSISLRVGDLDPLAVLQTIFEPQEPHLYLERSSVGESMAGAEAVVSMECGGPDRFDKMNAFTGYWASRSVVAGDTDDPMAGPVFFFAVTFDGGREDEDLAPATIFMPVWQVFRRNEGCLATANFKMGGDSSIEPVVERIWAASRRFGSFEYGGPGTGVLPVRSPGATRLIEDGEADRFRASVERVLPLIEEGQLNKVVLARSLDLEAEEPFLPLELLHLLREREPASTAFSFSNRSQVSFIGATPERLLRSAGDRFFTEAIAGSAPRGDSMVEDGALGRALIGSEKDLREHRYVVDSICRRLQSVGLKPVPGRAPGILKLSRVQHLRTLISGDWPERASFLKILGELHPTPAVGGTPREAALDCIRRTEPFSRGLYTGCLGWVRGEGEGEAWVALRTARIKGNRARLYAGGGVVQGSVPETETEETEFKLKMLLETLRG